MHIVWHTSPPATIHIQVAGLHFIRVGELLRAKIAQCSIVDKN